MEITRGQSDLDAAIETAKTLADQSGQVYAVHRCGDRFGVCAADQDSMHAIPNPDGPVRPVAAYYPDGTELPS